MHASDEDTIYPEHTLSIDLKYSYTLALKLYVSTIEYSAVGKMVSRMHCEDEHSKYLSDWQ